MPKVSFILPAYKRRFLKEAIASILAQTYRDFELVVVDDCSPENLREIVDGFDDGRLTYYRNETNIGGGDLVKAWNRALEYAKGEWVVCAGDDDVYHVDFAGELIKLSRKYPQVDVLHCRIAIIDGNGSVMSVGAPRAEFETGIEMLYHRAILRYNNQRIPDFMFRRVALLRAGGFYPSPRAWCSDIATVIEVGWENGVACSARILFKWRSSGENISSNFSDDYIDKLWAIKYFYAYIRQKIADAKPQTEDDGIILALSQVGVLSAERSAYRDTLCQLGCGKLCKVQRSGILPLRVVLREIISRLLRIVSFRFYIRVLRDLVLRRNHG